MLLAFMLITSQILNYPLFYFWYFSEICRKATVNMLLFMENINNLTIYHYFTCEKLDYTFKCTIYFWQSMLKKGFVCCQSIIERATGIAAVAPRSSKPCKTQQKRANNWDKTMAVFFSTNWRPPWFVIVTSWKPARSSKK